MNMQTKQPIDLANKPYITEQNDVISEKIAFEKLTILYKNLLLSVPANLLCATLVFISLLKHKEYTIFLGWYVAVVIVSLFRLLSHFLYSRLAKNYRLCLSLFILGVVSSAMLWGLADSVLMPNGELDQQMIIIVIVAGITAGGIQTIQGNLIASILYVIITLLPLCIWFSFQEGTSYLILTISMTAYLFFMLTTSWRGNKIINETLELRYKNLELIDDLSQTNRVIQKAKNDLEYSEHVFRNAMENAPIGMGVASISGKWLKVNKLFCNMLGYTQSELLQLSFQQITHPDDLEKSLAFTNDLVEGVTKIGRMEKRYIKKNGEPLWVMLSASIIHDTYNKPLYFIGHIEDISLEKQNKQMLDDLHKKTKDMLAELQQHENTIIAISKMNDKLQTCKLLSEAFSIIDFSAKQIFPDLSGGIAMVDDKDKYLNTVTQWGNTKLLAPYFAIEECWSLREGQIYMVNDVKTQMLCNHFTSPPTGSYICLPLIVQSKMFGILVFQCQVCDLAKRYDENLLIIFSNVVKLSLGNINLREELREQSLHDPLTGLYNRRYLNEVLARELIRAKNENKSMCVAMLDIDYFKSINDTFGHEAGDRVLEFIGSVLKENLRNGDVTARFGGEEFVILFFDTGINAADELLQQLSEQVKSAKISYQNQTLPHITISIGVAEAPIHGANNERIIQAADMALYSAKQAGRDKIVIYEK